VHDQQTTDQEHKYIYFPIPTTIPPLTFSLSSHITGSYSVMIIALQYTVKVWPAGSIQNAAVFVEGGNTREPGFLIVPGQISE
jgi:hypothetical protein